MKEILDLCMRVNKETKHTTFFSWAGHCSFISVEIRINGYKSDETLEKEYIEYVNTSKEAETFTKWKESKNLHKESYMFYLNNPYDTGSVERKLESLLKESE